MVQTDFLKLNLTTDDDGDMLFTEWRKSINGAGLPDQDLSNMQIIDKAFKDLYEYIGFALEEGKY